MAVAPTGLGQDGQDQTQVIEGQLDGVGYQIAATAAWNRKLLVFARDQTPPGQPKLAVIPIRMEPFKSLVDDGWMVATSGYRQTGITVRDGLTDIRKLINFIQEKSGRPERTLILGEGMGGAIALLLAENEPDEVDAALIAGHGFDLKDRHYPLALQHNLKIPVLFLANQPAMRTAMQYVGRAQDSFVPPAIWRVDRSARHDFTGPELLNALSALDASIDTETIALLRDGTVDAGTPLSGASFQKGGAFARVLHVDPSTGDIDTAFVARDLAKLGISPGDTFEANFKGNRQVVTWLADTGETLEPGQWGARLTSRGFVRVFVERGFAQETAQIQVDEPLFIKKDDPSG
ncbi:MAG: dienelactone hydrolase family protein [Opitutales bacterium]